MNISTVPVNRDGSYDNVYPKTGLPPATYNVIVQSPGTDGTLNIVMETTGQYSGQVVNAETGNNVFNFTGTGSVQDSVAAGTLSAAFSMPGVDDIYTRCTFQLAAPDTPAPVSMTKTPAPAATTKKSPVTFFTILTAAGVAGIAIAYRSRK